MIDDPLYRAAKAAQQRGGLVSVDPRELMRLVEEAVAKGDLIEEAANLLAYSSDHRLREWCERAESVSEFFE